jgi:hypothetical protein
MVVGVEGCWFLVGGKGPVEIVGSGAKPRKGLVNV